MKASIEKSFTTFLLTLILVLNPTFGEINGQETCPAIVRVTVSAEGCTKKKARDNLTAKISTVGTTTCASLACDPPTPSCIVNHVILIGKRAVCKRVPDTDDECHGKKKWVCTRDVNFDCQCFGDDGSTENKSNISTTNELDHKLEEKTFELFPNPVSQILNMEIRGYRGVTELLVFNIHGQVILSKNLRLQGQDKQSIDVSTLPEGMYIVSLNDNLTITTVSFTKK